VKLPLSNLIKSIQDELTQKWLVGAIVAAIGQAAIALGRQLTSSALLGQVLQSLFTALVIVAVLVVLLRLMRPQHGWPLTIAVIALAELVLTVSGSLLIAKHVDLDADPYLERDLALEGLLVDTYPTRIANTAYNQISVVRRPLVVTERKTHVLFDFLWTKRDGPDRTYVGKADLVAVRRRTTDGGWALDPFTVSNMSLAPKEGWIPYLFGWFEAPWLLAETEYFTRWVSDSLRTDPI
jgi:hypothetical protein